MAGPMLSIGVDVGGTNIKFGLVDESGGILFQKKTRTDPDRGSSAIIGSIVQEINAMVRQCAVAYRDLKSIGLGVPGTADSANGVVIYAPNLFWKHVAIVPAIQAAFHMPVFIAQDTRAAAWAEYVVGAGQGMRGIAAVTLGTGIGCGMVIDGRIFHGALNTAGEFGHQIVELNGELCNCGRRGCLEANAGGLAIVREAGKRISGVGELLHKDISSVTVSDVYQLAQQGNAQARNLTDGVVRYIGIGLVNLINLNSLEMIAISGGISNAPAELLLDPLIAFVRGRAYEAISEKVRICKSKLGEDAPLIGAALLHRAGDRGAPRCKWRSEEKQTVS